MSVNLNLNRTNFQAQLRSKPLRENEIDIENAVNDLQAQISAIATAATGTFAEITNARDYHSVLRNRLRSASKAQHNIVVSGGAITPQGSPNMTVHAAAGEAIVDGVACKWVASDSGTITAPTTARYDVVVANSDNSLSVVAGANTSAPFYPDIADSQVPLAVLSLTAGSTVINTAMITDMRSEHRFYYYGSGSWQHDWNPTRRTVKRQFYTSSGTWYKPYNVDTVKILLVGCGGAGGAGGGAGIGGGGGGAGQIIEKYQTVSADVIITVNSTGSSYFGSLTAFPGNDGSSGAAGGAGGAGAAGNGIGGYVLTGGTGGGGAGGYGAGGGGSNGSGGGAGGSGKNYVGGSGGASIGGGGGAGGYGSAGGSGGGSSSVGSSASGYGAGGGGGGGEGSGYAGGAGGPGLCIVEWEE